MKHIGIIGARDRDTPYDLHCIQDAFYRIYEPGDIIVSGGCAKGGDRFAEVITDICGIRPTLFPVDKSKLDPALAKKNYRAAYAQIAYARNKLIAAASDELIACVSTSRKGGTEDTIRKFEKFHPGKKAILV